MNWNQNRICFVMAEIILPQVELNIYTPKNPVEVTVVENRIVTRESSPNFIRHVTFDVSGTELEGKVRVGQSVGVLPPGEDSRGRPHKLRLYSVSSPGRGEGGERHLISTTVKRTIEEFEDKLYVGIASNYLADLKPGDTVRLTGPSGKRFLLPENARDFNYVFFSTGTGIAPFRGMIQELFEGLYENDCVLIFGCPYRTDLLYEEDFDTLAAAHKNFHYLKSISREGRRTDGSKDYVQTKLIDESKLLNPILSKPNTLLYICGLQGMETGIYRELHRLNQLEYFKLNNPLPDDVSALTNQELKRLLKPSNRLFVEVY